MGGDTLSSTSPMTKAGLIMLAILIPLFGGLLSYHLAKDRDLQLARFALVISILNPIYLGMVSIFVGSGIIGLVLNALGRLMGITFEGDVSYGVRMLGGILAFYALYWQSGRVLVRNTYRDALPVVFFSFPGYLYYILTAYEREDFNEKIGVYGTLFIFLLIPTIILGYVLNMQGNAVSSGEKKSLSHQGTSKSPPLSPSQSDTQGSLNISEVQKDQTRIPRTGIIRSEPQLEKRVFDRINDERRIRGLPAYAWNAEIARVARERSEDMLRNKYFAHTTPSGLHIDDILRQEGFFFLIANENLELIPRENATASAIVSLWMKSPGHRSLIIDKDNLYSDGGVGIACTEDACYATFVALGRRIEKNITLSQGWYQLFKLYPAEFPFTDPVGVNITVKAEKGRMEVLVTPREEDFTILLNGKPGLRYLVRRVGVKQFNWKGLISPNASLIIGAKEGIVRANITITYETRRGYNSSYTLYIPQKNT